MGWFKKSEKSHERESAGSSEGKLDPSGIDKGLFAEYLKRMFISLELVCVASKLEPTNDPGMDLYVLTTLLECGSMSNFSIDSQQLEESFNHIWDAFDMDAAPVDDLLKRRETARAKNMEIGEAGRQLTVEENRDGVIIYAAYLAAYEAMEQYEQRKRAMKGPDVRAFSPECLNSYGNLFFRAKR